MNEGHEKAALFGKPGDRVLTRYRPAADYPRQAQSRPAYAAPPRAPQQAYPPGNAQRQPWEDAGGGKN
jgi:hypothetical protein